MGPSEGRVHVSGRVGVVAGIALVAAAVTAVVGARQLSASVAEPRLLERQAAVGAAADAFDAVFTAALAELDAIRQRLEPWSPDPAADARSRAVLGEPPALGVLDGVLVVGPEGVVRAADAGHTALVGTGLDPSTGTRLRRNAAVLGPTHAGDGPGSIRVAAPLRGGDGATVGTLVGILAGDGQLAAVTESLARTDGVAPRLVWSDGTVLEPQGGLDRDPSLRAPAQLAAEGEGTQRLRGDAGQRLVVTYAPVRGGWAVAAAQPAAAFDAVARTPLVLTLLALAVVVMAAAVTTLVALRRAKLAREDADDARRSLLSVAGHELRTPLTVVSGGLQTLERRWEELTDDRRYEVVLFARRHVRRLEHQIERLLFAAQLERDATTGTAPRRLDVAEVVRSATEHQQALAPVHRFEVDTEPGCWVHADLRALDQVLFHLLENAVRYSPAGGTVTVRTRRDGGDVRIEVEDEGVGLPADPEPLFERFGQDEHVDTRVLAEGGLGLGLHIVRTFVERQGGTVTGANRPEGGALFVVVLPAATAAPTATEAPPGERVLGTGGRR